MIVESNDHQAEVPVEDNFRRKERSIKSFMKDISSQISHKRKWATEGLKEKDDMFSWSQVFDVRKELRLHRPLESTSDKAKFTECFSIPSTSCCSDIPHTCTNNSSFKSRVFLLNSYPSGLYIILNALCPHQQLHWAHRALADYSKEEHNNLSNLTKLSKVNHSTEHDGSLQKPSQERKEMSELEDEHDLWEKSCRDNNGFIRFRKLRWSCLGYHYDWTQRKYQRDLKSPFPDDIQLLCQNIARTVGQEFVPEAAIVNFYPPSSSMGGHLDDAEHNLDTPIVSLSIGRSALYLIGGRTKDVSPVPILLRSGDAVIMTGESRLCYHGIPWILSKEADLFLSDNPAEDCSSSFFSEYNECDTSFKAENGESLRPYKYVQQVIEYLQNHRININVRQVRISLDDNSWIDKNGTGYSKENY